MQNVPNINFIQHRKTALVNTVLESLTAVRTIAKLSFAENLFLITLPRSQYKTNLLTH